MKTRNARTLQHKLVKPQPITFTTLSYAKVNFKYKGSRFTLPYQQIIFNVSLSLQNKQNLNNELNGIQ